MRNIAIALSISLLFLFLSPLTFSQVTTNPGLPTADAPVLITLDITGTGLQGYTGDIYAHTGLTIGTSLWQKVIGSWGNNATQPKLTKISNSIYELNITPSIRQFYSAGPTDDINQICVVFRSADGTQQTSPDIFIDVYEASLNVSLVSPSQRPYFVYPGASIEIAAEAMMASTLSLYVDNTLLAVATGNSLSQTITASAEMDTKHWIKVVATDGTNTVADSNYYYVRGTVTVEDLPAGVRDGINYIDATTATLVLHAPYKSSVYVIGDFNDWQVGPEYKLKSNKSDINNVDTRYWVTLNNLVPGQEYIFQYLIDEEMRLADPYSEKLSDPWNDSYISNSTYPNLIDYPAGKTTGIASVLQTNQTSYTWEIPQFTPPAKTDLVIYETLIRDYTAAQTFKSIKDTISYLKRLGINVLELMPVNEFEGNISWGYNPSFFFAPDKYYGPKNELKKLIDECHKNGIAVVIDMVLNHAFGQCVLAQLYWDGANNRPAANNLWFNQTSPNPVYSWGSDFNHESPHTKIFIDSVARYWMHEYKVDGFRFDFTKGFTNKIGDGWAYDASRIAILKRFADAIWDYNPDAYVILEHLTDNSEEKELANYGMMLWGNLNHNYCEASMGWLPESDFSWISYQKRGWNNPAVVGYMESHDEERVMYKNLAYGNSFGEYTTKDTTIALQRSAMAAAFFFTIPGPKMIWEFAELGYDYSINWPSGTSNDRLTPKPPRWDYKQDYRRKYLFEVYSGLIHLKKNYDVFKTGNYTLSLTGAVKKITLTHTTGKVFVVGNFDVKETTATIDFPNTGKWYEYFSGDSITVDATSQSVTFQPGQYMLYSSFRIPKPAGLNTSVEESGNLIEKTITVYPNPSNGTVNFDLSGINEPGQLFIYDLNGRLITQFEITGNSPSMYTWASVDLTGSVYFYQFRSKNQNISGKFLINK